MSRQRQTSSKNSVYSDKELLTVDWTFGCRVSERQETTKTMSEVINRCIKMTDDIYTTDIKSRNEELKEIKLQIIYRWETVQRDKDPLPLKPRRSEVYGHLQTWNFPVRYFVCSSSSTRQKHNPRHTWRVNDEIKRNVLWAWRCFCHVTFRISHSRIFTILVFTIQNQTCDSGHLVRGSSLFSFLGESSPMTS